MLLVNTPTVPNKEIKEVHGLARGNAVRARNVGHDIFARKYYIPIYGEAKQIVLTKEEMIM
jgi:uncharacterized protein YbjQ (UPF0145 family)